MSATDLTKTTAVAVLELARLGRLTDETTAALSEAVDPKPEPDDTSDDAAKASARKATR